MAKFKVWSPYDHNELRQLWFKNVPADEIAERLGRTRAAVLKQACELGLRARMFTRWTEHEKATLGRVGLEPWSVILAALPFRSKIAIMNKLKEHGFHRSRIRVPWNKGKRRKDDALLLERLKLGTYADVGRRDGVSRNVIAGRAFRQRRHLLAEQRKNAQPVTRGVPSMPRLKFLEAAE
jgi:hypothetical protein